MRITTYKCDKCGAEDTTNEIDLEQVGGVFVRNDKRSHSFFVCNPETQLTKEWCRDCRIRCGLIPTIKEPRIEVTPLTLEDMVREMISEEIQAAINTK